MAKRNNKSTQKPTTTELETEEESIEVKLTKEEKLALFQAYDAAQLRLVQAEKAVSKAREDRSKAVETIIEKLGNGPFRYKGEELVAMKGKNSYHFRGKSQKEVEEI